MSSLVLTGDTSGTVTLAAPAVAGTNTLTLLAATATSSVNVLATAVASTSGTSIDFTSLPAWVKRITVMFNAISGSGTSNIMVQLGTGSTPTYTTSGYLGSTSLNATNTQFTTGLGISSGTGAASVVSGQMLISTIGSNTWVAQSIGGYSNAAGTVVGAGSIALAAALTAVRITTVNGTDTFDAGSINILYEG